MAILKYNLPTSTIISIAEVSHAILYVLPFTLNYGHQSKSHLGAVEAWKGGSLSPEVTYEGSVRNATEVSQSDVVMCWEFIVYLMHNMLVAWV